jgi:hypothetical protein
MLLQLSNDVKYKEHNRKEPSAKDCEYFITNPFLIKNIITASKPNIKRKSIFIQNKNIFYGSI